MASLRQKSLILMRPFLLAFISTAILCLHHLAGITLCILLTTALVIENIETFNLALIFDTAVLSRFVVLGVVFCFLHIYTYKKYAKPHQDMLVDLHYHIAELEDFYTTEIND